QGPRASGVRRLDPDVGEPGGLRADGHGRRAEGATVVGERCARGSPGGPRGGPGPRVPQAVAARRRPAGGACIRAVRSPAVGRRPLPRAGCEPDPGVDGDRRVPEGGGRGGGSARLITRPRLAGNGTTRGSGPRGSRTVRGSLGRNRTG